MYAYLVKCGKEYSEHEPCEHLFPLVSNCCTLEGTDTYDGEVVVREDVCLVSAP